jgi:hypothetical protein
VATWNLFSRGPAPAYALTGGLPIVSVQVTRRHLGVSAAVIVTPHSEDAAARLDKRCGVSVRRDGVEEFGGLITSRHITWDADSGRFLLTVHCEGDEVVLRDRLAFPDPLRDAFDQTVNDYWQVTAPASTAMLQLISDQAGPTARPDRQVPGLTIGPDPLIGAARRYRALFTDVMGTLGTFSVASKTNLGVRVAPTGNGLRATLYDPRDLRDTVRFSAHLSNLVGFEYTETAPTVTHALAAGQGDLHLRLRRGWVNDDPTVQAWGRQVWSYIDRRDTPDAADLTEAAQDELADAGPTVALAVTLTDSQAVQYGRDWGLGDMVTVYVGGPDQAAPATVADVVREVYLEVRDDGAETIRPAIGTDDAKALIPPPTQTALAKIGRRLSGLETRK